MSAQFPFPARSGFETRVYQLARQLASRHDVTLLSYVEPGRQDDVERLREHLGVEVVQRDQTSRALKRASQLLSALSPQPFTFRAIHSRAMQEAIDALCSSRHFDVIQLESSVLRAFRFPAAPKLLLDSHNVEYEVLERIHAGERSLPRRAFGRLEYLRYRRYERRLWRQADGCALTSEREEQIVRAHAPGTPTAVVPNGVDLEYFHPNQLQSEPNTAVFNGVLDYRPNLDAAYYLVDELWPRVLDRFPSAQLTIVGRAGPLEISRLQRPGVAVTGQVPDVRPYLAKAAVVLVPIRMGGGTRLKVVEGLAMGKPMVSTSLGCEGVNVQDEEHLLVADAPGPFTTAVQRLFEDRSLAAALGRAGRSRMEQEYSWDLAGARLDDLYGRLLAGA